MKIASAIRAIYRTNVELYGLLRDIVDDLLKSRKEEKWHFESRIKEEQSYALKLETGRYPSHDIDDFYAATLVVEDHSKIDSAVDIIQNDFSVIRKRPTDDVSGRQKPWDFRFTDVRLICCLGDNWSDKENLNHLNFEIQVKTFLQHAWSIATHDLIYKSQSPNWSLERVAYQIKSMLEHAELSILEAKALGISPLIQREHIDYKHIAECIQILNEFWSEAELPNDQKRLAENVSQFIKMYDASISEAREALIAKRSELGGHLYLNLSPFNTIVDALYSINKNKFIACLDSMKKKKRTLIIACDMMSAEDDAVLRHGNVKIIR